MNEGLKIPREGKLDFLSLGAVVHRFDPGIVPFRKAVECQIHVSGGEYNVAANLADCFRLQTGIATAMVDYPIAVAIPRSEEHTSELQSLTKLVCRLRLEKKNIMLGYDTN